MKSLAPIMLALLALAACKGEQAKETGGKAQGEVLPGSVSDAMLPLDTVKSQAPLAPKAEGGDKGDAKKSDKKADSAAEESAPVAAEAPPAADEAAGE
ncbi:hypothetical protein [Novosphingobium sp.]|uniref:hypothetical protein n=1 Tax=Novosphingobium sp. TaxID=1874826 RepID=UPI0025D0A507|nr:hypothetical protein [Novosphingobium sp.]MCC6926350.1 hypothetical protein [Novosphingobium sp.]